jgi:hypothetical protein
LYQGVPVRVAFALCLLAACRPPGYGKGDGTPDAPAASPDAAVAGGHDASPDGVVAQLCHKGFRLDQHGEAGAVYLTGDFVQWGADPQHGAIAFVLGADSGWTVSHDFAAGSYQYKFIVDGNWILDPTNPDVVDDGMGHQNSAFTCTP